MAYTLIINNEHYKNEVYQTIYEAIEKATQLAKEESSRRNNPVLSLIRLFPKDVHKVKLFYSNDYEIYLQRV
jgi:phosphatidylserine decarboxylase